MLMNLDWPRISPTDWHGKMQYIRFPVQVIDAARDTLINIAWHFAHHFQGARQSGLLDQLLPILDDISDNKSLDDLKSMRILPAAWISRHVRIHAIQSAKTTVKLSVEHFALPTLAREAGGDLKTLMNQEKDRYCPRIFFPASEMLSRRRVGFVSLLW